MKCIFFKFSNGRFLHFFIFGLFIIFLNSGCSYLQNIQNDVADIKSDVAIIEDTGTTALGMAKIVADSLGLLTEEGAKKWEALQARHELVKKDIKETRQEEKKQRENQTDTLGYILLLISAVGSYFFGKEFKIFKGAGLLVKSVIKKGKKKT